MRASKSIALQRFILFTLLILASLVSQAQTRISGQVTDAATGEALPFVGIFVKNSSIGTSTDVEGKYNIRLSSTPDSLTAAFVGYLPLTLPVQKGVATQTLDFKLQTNAQQLQEVVIRPGENPAWPIMRRVMDNKNANDKRKLTAYQYEAYTKMQFDVDNVGQQKGKGVVGKAIESLVDSQMYLAGEDGKKLLPFFLSESLSDVYYTRDPKRSKEIIKATKVTGIGLQDGTLVSQVIGSNYQDYNFYQNWVSVLQKNFISPIADGWKSYYTYELEDSTYIGDDWCYELSFKQKRPQDLAFNGRMWITADGYALRKLEATVSKSANINFVESIALKQELQPVGEQAWMPADTEVKIKIVGLTPKRPGILAKVYTSYQEVVVNQPQKPDFFDKPVELLAGASKQAESFWEERRHDTLSLADQQVYATINALRETPRVKRFSDIVTVLGTGYKSFGKVSWGPWPYTYALNDVEGHRFQVGGKTNINFSNKLELRGYVAYGTKDQAYKYSLGGRYIFNRKRWSELGFTHQEDLQQVGLMSDRLASSPFFLGFSRFGELRRPVMVRESNLYLQRDVLRGVTERVSMRTRHFDPQYDFAYYKNGPAQPDQLASSFTATEVSFLTRYAKDEVYVENDNERISLGSGSYPVLSLKYTLGLNNALGATVDYQRVDLGVEQDFVMGRLGNAMYRLEAGKIFSPVPYPLLEVHTGNETPFYYDATYNLMDYFEFASDTYAALHYEQYFEGLLFNRLPLIKKLKWRVLGSANVLYGSLSQSNLDLMPEYTPAGNRQEAFKTLGDTPYVELGYGIENIFKILRVDAFHRLTHLDEGTRKFGLKFSVQFKL
ncbi:CarboxypepD_reg-like domain-containing protein [Pontibacter chinhatensis]|uniref:CarboxypepD_reg-like domain-containing protein n=1 Tax=Pontibacter chinhatensis TaxID=1436961 RepID=A0A1I2YXQ3_9BACT|nr:CarboxypepD_reg-like domain-containing protein [Pontibacter chinhatensis]